MKLSHIVQYKNGMAAGRRCIFQRKILIKLMICGLRRVGGCLQLFISLFHIDNKQKGYKYIFNTYTSENE